MSIRKKIIPISAAVLFSLPLLAVQNRPLLPRHATWVQIEVEAIITDTEKDVFLKLTGDEERDQFILEFWKQRDPTPATPRNEFKDEHYRRIEFANRTFGRNTPEKGWRTARGRTYIQLGSPANVDRFETGTAYPIEIWYYYGNPALGQPTYFRLVFYRRGGSGDYIQFHPLSDGPKVLVPNTAQNTEADGLARVFAGDQMMTSEMTYPRNWDEDDRQAFKILRHYVSFEAAEATYSLIPGSSDPSRILASAVILAQIQKSPQNKVNDKYALDFLTHKASVDVSYSIHQIGNRSIVGVLRAPSGMFFLSYLVVPETLSLESFQEKYIADLKTTVRVTDGAGRTVFQDDKFIPIELRKEEVKAVEKKAFHFSDAFPIVPGVYAFDLLMENTVTKEFTSVAKRISIPGDNQPWMSPLLLAREVTRDLTPGGSSLAFRAGPYQLFPSINNVFKQKDSVFVFFQVFGLEKDLVEQGMIEYKFTRGGKVISTTRKAVRDFADSADCLLEYSTAKDGPGIYEVRAALLDGQGREVMSDQTSYQVQTAAPPGLWVVAQEHPSTEDPVHSFILGTQYLNVGLMEKGLVEFRKAYKAKPDSLKYALSYARSLRSTNDPSSAFAVLSPFTQTSEMSFEICESMGRIHQDLKDLKKAISWYEKALSLKGNPVEVLNALGECHFSLGERDLALKVWSKSLEINPSQEYVRKMVEGLKR